MVDDHGKTKQELIDELTTLRQELTAAKDQLAELKEAQAEHRQVERALGESEERFRDLVEHSFDLICTHDLEGELLSVNPAAERITGYTAEELIGMNIRDFLSPEVRDQFDDYLAEIEREGEASGLMLSVDRSGEQVILEYHNSLRIEGVPAPIVRGTARDITERKRTEKALQEREDRLSKTMLAANDGMWDWDLTTDEVYFDPRYYEMAGYEVDAFPHRLEEFQKRVHPDDVDNVMEQAQKHLDGEIDRFVVEFRFKKKDGDWRWILGRGVIVERDEDGTPLRFVGTHTDIAERKRTEKELRQQERLATVGQLAAGIAHDFRNLLGTIILYAQMDLNVPDTPPGLANHLRIIVEESKRATELVQQILDFSSRAMMKREPLDMSGFLGQTLSVLRRTIPESVCISLHVEPPKRGQDGQAKEGAALTVLADPGRLRQVLTNLALNARDAMPEGGDLRLVLSRLELAANDTPPVAEMKPGAWVCLAVSDTGEGMTEEVQEHLFEPFFTTKEVGEGTGLGLAQVYGIIRQHEGAIDVETAPGEGTTFRIYLPAEDVEPKAEDADGGGASPGPQARGEILLLVEDNRSLREAAERILASLGYRVLTAADGREALDIYRAAEGVDLVITDLVMPNMGGEALMRALTAGRRHPGSGSDLRAVGITGYAVEDVTAELREAGFVDLIQKPFSSDELATVIRRVLDAGQGR